jgi:hypothetical protein
MKKRRFVLMWAIRASAMVAVVFGLLTIKAGGSVLFGDGSAARAAGHYVGFIVWFNFLAGFAYVAAGIGLWLKRRWAAWLALGLAAMTVAAFAIFGLYVASGGAFEMRTVWAMTLRSAIWISIGLLACRAIGCGRKDAANG